MYKRVIDEIRKERYTVDTVEKAAALLLSVKEVGIPVKIVEMCTAMGFAVYRQALPQEMCGYIVIDGELKDRFETDRIISVNENESSKRRRFTVAHELGHFLFDFTPDTIQFYNAFERNHDAGSDEKEILASRFAAELLMPKDVFMRQYRQTYKERTGSSEQLYETVQELSDIFLVPPKAVERRVKEELKLYVG